MADGSAKKLANRLSSPHQAPEMGSFVFYESNGEVGCRQATLEEAQAMLARRPNQRLHVLTPIRPNQDAGLKIVLRGTTQLEKFPEAKAAFLKAAATWEGLIQTPITVIIDVDFGPTRFGESYRSGVLGSTATQVLGAEGIYPDVRQVLIETASSDEERALYTALPEKKVPTDVGSSDTIFAPSSVFRALGALDPVPNPDSEAQDFGAPPSIGFNSNFSFDFDPSNGIDLGRIDFDATATHEIGHALGFSSNTGLRELSVAVGEALTIWDLFRFRPGITLESFATANRILSSGGVQIFFSGESDVPLSTGRPNGTGGDGAQASHWKADGTPGVRVGIMEPFLSPGERAVINKNDLKAIDLFGYQLKGQSTPDSIPPTVKVTEPAAGQSITASSEVNITWTSADNVGVARHDIALSTDGGATFPVTIAAGLPGNAQSFRWTAPSIQTTEARIRVTAVDAANNQGVDSGSGNFSIITGTGTSEDFMLSLQPAQQTIAPGASASFKIDLQTLGFTQPVNLSAVVTSPSTDITATLSSNTITPGASVTLNVAAAPTAQRASYTVTITGTGGQVVRTATAAVDVVGPDFELFFDSEVSFVTRGMKGQFGINIRRFGGFAGNVTITAPDTKAIKVKIKNTTLSTTGAGLNFDFKVKKKASVGSYPLTFTGVDEAGRVRTATFTLLIN
jgi:hypothetical protein